MLVGLNLELVRTSSSTQTKVGSVWPNRQAKEEIPQLLHPNVKFDDFGLVGIKTTLYNMM
jgi:hypothetical protein